MSAGTGNGDTRRRWCWSCALCPAHGLAASEGGALSGWAWHYQQKHRETT